MVRTFLRWSARILGSLLGLACLALLTLWLTPKLRPVTGDPVSALEGPLAFQGVTVVNPGEAEAPVRTVLVREGRIEAMVDPQAPVPAGYRVVAGEGRFLMPGLVDLHIHAFDESDLALLLAHGVTSARNMMGLPFHLRFKAGLKAGRITGPRFCTASPTLNGPKSVYPIHQVVKTPEQARQRVAKAAEAGCDLIKVYQGVSPEVLEAIVEEAGRRGLPVAGHLPEAVSWEKAMQAFVSLEHAEELFEAMEKAKESPEAFAARIVKGGKPVVATLQVFQQLVDALGQGEAHLASLQSPWLNPTMAGQGRAGLAPWTRSGPKTTQRLKSQAQTMARLVKAIHDQGGDIVLGTDYGPHLTIPGASAIRELHLLHAAGIPLDAVLKGATSSAAKVLGKERSLGRIAPGFLADGILLNGDPRLDLKVLDHPAGILSQGRWFDEDGRKALLRRGERHAGAILTWGRMLEGVVGR